MKRDFKMMTFMNPATADAEAIKWIQDCEFCDEDTAQRVLTGMRARGLVIEDAGWTRLKFRPGESLTRYATAKKENGSEVLTHLGAVAHNDFPHFTEDFGYEQN